MQWLEKNKNNVLNIFYKYATQWWRAIILNIKMTISDIVISFDKSIDFNENHFSLGRIYSHIFHQLSKKNPHFLLA